MIDSFRVEHTYFKVVAPNNWVIEQVSEELNGDSTWNCILRHVVSQPNLNAQIALRIENNSSQPDGENPTPERNKKKQPKVLYTAFQDLTGYSITFHQSKVKHCTGCGKLNRKVFLAPVSDKKSLFIVFNGNGRRPAIDSLIAQYNRFCNDFISLNQEAFDSFLLLNDTISTTDTITINGRHFIFFKNGSWNSKVVQDTAVDVTNIYLTQQNGYYSDAYLAITIAKHHSLAKYRIVTDADLANQTKNNAEFVHYTMWRYSIQIPKESSLLEYSQTYYVSDSLLKYYEFTYSLSVVIPDRVYESFYARSLNSFALTSLQVNKLNISLSPTPMPGDEIKYDTTFRNQLIDKYGKKSSDSVIDKTHHLPKK